MAKKTTAQDAVSTAGKEIGQVILDAVKNSADQTTPAQNNTTQADSQNALHGAASRQPGVEQAKRRRSAAGSSNATKDIVAGTTKAIRDASKKASQERSTLKAFLENTLKEEHKDTDEGSVNDKIEQVLATLERIYGDLEANADRVTPDLMRQILRHVEKTSAKTDRFDPSAAFGKVYAQLDAVADALRNLEVSPTIEPKIVVPPTPAPKAETPKIAQVNDTSVIGRITEAISSAVEKIEKAYNALDSRLDNAFNSGAQYKSISEAISGFVGRFDSFGQELSSQAGRFFDDMRKMFSSNDRAQFNGQERMNFQNESGGKSEPVQGGFPADFGRRPMEVKVVGLPEEMNRLVNRSLRELDNPPTRSESYDNRTTQGRTTNKLINYFEKKSGLFAALSRGMRGESYGDGILTAGLNMLAMKYLAPHAAVIGSFLLTAGGILAGVASIGATIYNLSDTWKEAKKNEERGEYRAADAKRVSTGTGTAMGTAVGSVLGFMLGGPLGAFIGGAIGSTAGSIAGRLVGNSVASSVENLGEMSERRARGEVAPEKRDQFDAFLSQKYSSQIGGQLTADQLKDVFKTGDVTSLVDFAEKQTEALKNATTLEDYTKAQQMLSGVGDILNGLRNYWSTSSGLSEEEKKAYNEFWRGNWNPLVYDQREKLEDTISRAGQLKFNQVSKEDLTAESAKAAEEVLKARERASAEGREIFSNLGVSAKAQLDLTKRFAEMTRSNGKPYVTNQEKMDFIGALLQASGVGTITDEKRFRQNVWIDPRYFSFANEEFAKAFGGPEVGQKLFEALSPLVFEASTNQISSEAALTSFLNFIKEMKPEIEVQVPEPPAERAPEIDLNARYEEFALAAMGQGQGTETSPPSPPPAALNEPVSVPGMTGGDIAPTLGPTVVPTPTNYAEMFPDLAEHARQYFEMSAGDFNAVVSDALSGQVTNMNFLLGNMIRGMRFDRNEEGQYVGVTTGNNPMLVHSNQQEARRRFSQDQFHQAMSETTPENYQIYRSSESTDEQKVRALFDQLFSYLPDFVYDQNAARAEYSKYTITDATKDGRRYLGINGTLPGFLQLEELSKLPKSEFGLQKVITELTEAVKENTDQQGKPKEVKVDVTKPAETPSTTRAPAPQRRTENLSNNVETSAPARPTPEKPVVNLYENVEVPLEATERRNPIAPPQKSSPVEAIPASTSRPRDEERVRPQPPTPPAEKPTVIREIETTILVRDSAIYDLLTYQFREYFPVLQDIQSALEYLAGEGYQNLIHGMAAQGSGAGAANPPSPSPATAQGYTGGVVAPQNPSAQVSGSTAPVTGVNKAEASRLLSGFTEHRIGGQAFLAPSDWDRNSYHRRGQNAEAEKWLANQVVDVAGAQLSSRAGWRNKPTPTSSEYHRGVDVVGGQKGAIEGANLKAFIGGTVIGANTQRGYGQIVTIKGDDGNIYRYAHMKDFGVQAGQRVEAGQSIGHAGHTGVGTGSHLHFEIRDSSDKRVIDPVEYAKVLMQRQSQNPPSPSPATTQGSGTTTTGTTLGGTVRRAPTAQMQSLIDRQGDFIAQQAQKYGIPVDMLLGQIQQESGGRRDARSGAGAVGLMQLMPGTAKDLGVTDRTDERQSIEAGARYMGQLLKRYNGNMDNALMAYNWGMGNVDKYLKGQKTSVPKEAAEYAARVRARAANYTVEGGTTQPGTQPAPEVQQTPSLVSTEPAAAPSPMAAPAPVEIPTQGTATGSEVLKAANVSIQANAATLNAKSVESTEKPAEEKTKAPAGENPTPPTNTETAGAVLPPAPPEIQIPGLTGGDIAPVVPAQQPAPTTLPETPANAPIDISKLESIHPNFGEMPSGPINLGPEAAELAKQSSILDGMIGEFAGPKLASLFSMGGSLPDLLAEIAKRRTEENSETLEKPNTLETPVEAAPTPEPVTPAEQNAEVNLEPWRRAFENQNSNPWQLGIEQNPSETIGDFADIAGISPSIIPGTPLTTPPSPESAPRSELLRRLTQNTGADIIRPTSELGTYGGEAVPESELEPNPNALGMNLPGFKPIEDKGNIYAQMYNTAMAYSAASGADNIFMGDSWLAQEARVRAGLQERNTALDNVSFKNHPEFAKGSTATFAERYKAIWGVEPEGGRLTDEELKSMGIDPSVLRHGRTREQEILKHREGQDGVSVDGENIEVNKPNTTDASVIMPQPEKAEVDPVQQRAEPTPDIATATAESEKAKIQTLSSGATSGISESVTNGLAGIKEAVQPKEPTGAEGLAGSTESGEGRQISDEETRAVSEYVLRYIFGENANGAGVLNIF